MSIGVFQCSTKFSGFHCRYRSRFAYGFPPNSQSVNHSSSVVPAVNQVHERVAFPRGEAGGLLQPPEHGIAQRADESELLGGRQVERRDGGVGVVCERPPRDPDFGWLRVALMEVDQRATIRRDL